MDYQGIGMITVFLILVTLFVWSIVSNSSKDSSINTKPEINDIKIN